MTAASAWTPLVVVAGLTAACLLPFAGKAFHIDDPLFLWAARQIQSHPLDPYGFIVNWYGHAMPMADVTKNPPLAAYFIAMAASGFGWSEVAMHFAFVLPAIGVTVGTYVLAERFTRWPLFAALSALLTPAFLVSGTTVMSDVLMLALWLAATILWMRGLDRERWLWFGAAGVLLGAGALTKYYAITLLPLLLVYTMLKRRRIGPWAWALLVPTGILVVYEWATLRLYGRGLLADAFGYATDYAGHMPSQAGAQLLTLLSFTGGCVAVVIWCLPLVWPRAAIAAFVGAAGVGGALLHFGWSGLHLPLIQGQPADSWQAGQMAILVGGGVSVVWLAVSELRRWRDADAAFLGLWILGTFVFAGFVNWSINGRSILPMVPAVGIVLARRLDERKRPPSTAALAGSLVPAAALALIVTHGDYAVAATARVAASEIHQRYATGSGQVWFQGHWGFQYYMEALGAKAMDVDAPAMQPGDVIVYPLSGTNVVLPPPGVLGEDPPIALRPDSWASTMAPHVAGFYAGVGRPLPFVIGPAPAEVYRVYRMPPRVR